MAPNNDDETLRILAILHVVLAGITAVFSLFPLLHVGFGLLMMFSPESQGEGLPPEFARVFGGLFMVLGCSFIAAGLTFAGCVAYAAKFLTERRRHTFCVVVAAIETMFVPLGTALGIFTLITLMRDSVRERFATVARQ